MCVEHGQDAELFAHGGMVMKEINCPDLVWPDRFLTVPLQLRIHLPLRVLIPELQVE